jgi:hypothetical protein
MAIVLGISWVLALAAAAAAAAAAILPVKGQCPLEPRPPTSLPTTSPHQQQHVRSHLGCPAAALGISAAGVWQR